MKLPMPQWKWIVRVAMGMAGARAETVTIVATKEPPPVRFAAR